ncbi:neutral amino acid transporter [Phlyctochytrium planicorne]|nr:neutral amino acid transporter [Phlyctochytrium planicorne]
MSKRNSLPPPVTPTTPNPRPNSPAFSISSNHSSNPDRPTTPVSASNNNNNSNNGSSSKRTFSQPSPSPTPTPSSSKAIKKRSSYGALLAASSYHNAVLGTSFSSSASGGAASDHSHSPVVTNRRPSSGLGMASTSLPRAIPPSSRVPLDGEGSDGGAMSFKKSFSPGKLAGPLARAASPSPMVDVVGEREAARMVSEHLVDGVIDGQDGSFTGAHGLMGGAVTHDIYQWQQKHSSRPRRNSDPTLPSNHRSPTVTASILQEPGMFRRHFVTSRAEMEGRVPNVVTRNFIDFLLMYGFYGGDVVPDDETEADYGADDVEQHEGSALLGGSGGAGSGGGVGGRRAHQNAGDVVHGTSARKVFFMLIKAFVGTGVLFLPKAFSNGGMGFSIILLVVLGWLTLHCMLLLVETSRTLGGSFGDLGEKLYGKGMRGLVLWSIAVSQAGFGCAYLIFVGQNLRDLVMVISECRWVLPLWVFLVGQLALYVPLAWVRRIKHFSVPSLIADVFILMGLAYIFYYDLTVLSTTGVAPGMVWFNMESFSLFVGTAMFAFEGICLILPIAESMKQPEKFGWVLTTVIVTIGVTFVTIGAMGYLTFGSKVETVVFLNLPKGSKVVMGLQFVYALAIMLSFPLTVYPSIRIIEAGLFGVRDGKHSMLVKWEKNGFRALFVGLLAYIAYAGSNNLDKFVSLVGCFACVPLSFIYPALFHYHIAKSNWTKAKDIAIVVFGVVALFYTTYVTIWQWIVAAPDLPIDRCVSSPDGR